MSSGTASLAVVKRDGAGGGDLQPMAPALAPPVWTVAYSPSTPNSERSDSLDHLLSSPQPPIPTLGMLHGLWDLSFATRDRTWDQTWAPGSESTKS